MVFRTEQKTNSSSSTPVPYIRTSRKAAALASSALLVFLALLGGARPASAIYQIDNGLVITAPPPDLVDHGWMYMGVAERGTSYLGRAAVVIAPNWFITATHVAGSYYLDNGSFAGFSHDGTSYQIDGRVDSPFSDLTLFHVNGTFSNYAPLYTGSHETGAETFMFGQSSIIPGSEIVSTTGQVNGYTFADGGYLNPSALPSWGSNRVNQIVTDPHLGDFLYMTYDAPGTGDYIAHEAGVAGGDSGGGVFVMQNGQWALAGIMYGIEAQYNYTDTLGPNGYDPYWGYITDARGLYQMQYDDQGNQIGLKVISGDNPVPYGAVATRISSNFAWISSVTGVSAVSAVPEPSSAALALLGLPAAFAFTRMRRRMTYIRKGQVV